MGYSNIKEQINLEYKLVLPTSMYQKNNNIWAPITSLDELKKVIQEGITLKIVGIIKAKDEATATSINGSVGYTKGLITKVMQVLFLIKKSDDNNLFHAEASPNITTEQQDALDANIGRVIEENGGGKSAESVSN